MDEYDGDTRLGHFVSINRQFPVGDYPFRVSIVSTDTSTVVSTVVSADSAAYTATNESAESLSKWTTVDCTNISTDVDNANAMDALRQ